MFHPKRSLHLWNVESFRPTICFELCWIGDIDPFREYQTHCEPLNGLSNLEFVVDGYYEWSRGGDCPDGMAFGGAMWSELTDPRWAVGDHRKNSKFTEWYFAENKPSKCTYSQFWVNRPSSPWDPVADHHKFYVDLETRAYRWWDDGAGLSFESASTSTMTVQTYHQCTNRYISPNITAMMRVNWKVS